MISLKGLKEKLQNNKRSVITFFILISILFSFKAFYNKLPSRFIISSDTSLPNRFWFIKPYERGQIKVGDYVIFRIFFNYKNRWDPKKDVFLKMVACVPGQRLLIKEMKVYCDGKMLGKIREKDSEGDPVKHFEYDGIVPEGKYFVMGTHERSYDSRYFGFVDRKYIIKRAYPIW